MRRLGLIFVGISALGCRDPDASKPQKGSGEAPAPAPKQMTPDPTPALNPPAPDVPHDEAWREAMAKTIKAVAPDLSDVSCAATACSATLTATSKEELVAKAEALQAEASLKQLEARGVVLSAPTEQGGKASMKIRVLFDE